MYQRQIKKQSLSGAVVDARESDKVHFSSAELKVCKIQIHFRSCKKLYLLKFVYIILKNIFLSIY